MPARLLSTAARALHIGRAVFAPVRDPAADDDLLPPDQRRDLAAALLNVLGYLEPELRAGERIPRQGGALLVGNHALLGVDSFALLPLVIRETGRVPRGLADRVVFRTPLLDRLMRRCGAVEGTRANAERLLRAGELVLVYPGGAAESFKAPDQHYKLLWQGHYGFVKVAMRTQAPIVPVMAAGVDHAYRYLGHERVLARRLLGKGPVWGPGEPRYDFPIALGLGPLPLPGKFTYHVGEPMMPPPDPALADDPAAVAAFHGQVHAAAQALLDAAVRQWHAERAQAS